VPKAYSYLRFSTPEQIRGDSFRRQSDAAAAYARMHGLELDERSFQDLGVSAYRGANLETGRLGEFLEAVRIGAVERGSYLLVESLDRLSRASARRAVRVLEGICDEGVKVVTLGDGRLYDSHSLDSDPMAFMWAFLVAIRANEESATKSRRLREAWKAKRGRAGERRLTAKCPAWLRPTEGGGFEPVEDKAATVRRIFEMAAAGVGQHAIAETLNREDVEPFGEGKRQGRFWHRSYVAKVLRNPAVIGTLTPHTIEHDDAGKRRRVPQDPVPNYFPPVVTPERFAEVNGAGRRPASSKRGRHAAGPVRNMLAGLALCPTCGGTMTRVVKGNRARPRLVCARAKAQAGCAYRSVPQEDVERALIHHAGPLSDPPSGDEAADEALAAAERAVNALEEQINHLAHELARRPSPAIRNHLAELELELPAARRARDVAIDRVAALSSKMIAANARAFYEAATAEEPDPEAVNLALRRIVSGVVVEPEAETLVFRWVTGGEMRVPYGAAGYGLEVHPGASARGAKKGT
jgi:DNA invertase Pin-like site-specific DNA recombinase